MKHPILRGTICFVQALVRQYSALCACILLCVLIVLAICAPWITSNTPYDLATIDILDANLPPAWDVDGDSRFLLGTDTQGRDIFSLILYGLRVSLVIGVGAVVLQALLGTILGVLAGYKGGWYDTIIMRIADIELSFSTYIIAIFAGAIIQSIFGVAYYNTIALPLLICIIGFAEWPQYARTVRAKVLSEKNKEYVEAAKMIGLTDIAIMRKHILLNTLSPVVVLASIQVANAIMSEAALSFLGLGMPPTTPSLGAIIKEGFQYFFSGYWWIVTFPSITLILLILSINVLGDFIRDYMNPKQ